MARRGELKEMDAFEEEIRNNARYYNITLFRPGHATRICRDEIADFDTALEHAQQTFDLEGNENVRAAMIYAVNAAGRHALMGTIHRQTRKYKPAQVKRH